MSVGNFTERDAIIERINQNSASWDADFREALAKREFCKWMAIGGRSKVEATQLAAAICDECRIEDGAISLEWYEKMQEEHIQECRQNQGVASQQIDHLRLQVESAGERHKALKSDLVEAQSYLQQLARAFSEPLIPDLPPAPNRQLEIVVEGEEWRLVPLADVLSDTPKMKAVALEKLGNITLGAYADLAVKWANAGKPQKITTKQFDAIEASVQRWHEANAEDEGEDADE